MDLHGEGSGVCECAPPPRSTVVTALPAANPTANAAAKNAATTVFPIVGAASILKGVSS